MQTARQASSGLRQVSRLVPADRNLPRHRSYRSHSRRLKSTRGVRLHVRLKNAFYLRSPGESCKATRGYTGAPESTACSTTAMTIAHPRVRGPGQAWGYPRPPP